MNTYSVLQNFKKEKHFFNEPYPHIVIENCLPLKTFEMLYENFPVQTVKDNFNLVDGHTYRGLANDFIGSKRVGVQVFTRGNKLLNAVL